MRRLLYSAVVYCLMVGMAPLALAKEPSSEALREANKLFDLTFSGTFFENLTAQVWKSVEQALKAKNPSISEDVLSTFKSELMAIQQEQMADVMKEAPRIYARHFTVDELKQLYDFQASPIGKKSLKVMPQIMGELMPLILKHAQQAGPRVMQKLQEKIKQKGYKI